VVAHHVSDYAHGGHHSGAAGRKQGEEEERAPVVADWSHGDAGEEVPWYGSYWKG
jgi:hypothetical protein